MMRTRAETILSLVWAFFVRLVIIVLLAYFFYRVRAILVAVMLSVFLTYVTLPAIEFLCSKGKRIKGWSYRSRRFWASVLVFIGMLFMTGVTIRYVVAPFVSEANAIKGNMGQYVTNLETVLQRANVWYSELPDEAKSLFGSKDKNTETIKMSVVNWARRVLSGTAAWAGRALDIILIPVLAFYFALDYRSLKREFVGALPRTRRREAVVLLRHVGRILQSYIVGQFVLCVIAGVAVAILLWILHLPYVLALAVFAGVTRAIPIVGPIISGIVIVLLGLITSPMTALWLLVTFSLLHLSESKFLLPALIGHQMRLHPAVIIIVLLIGGEFFGLFGMFLAVPVAAVIRELVRFYVIRPRVRQEALEHPATSA